MRTSALAIAALAAVPVFGQQPAGAQCGGDGFTDDTSCVAGYTCVVYDDCYSQCDPESSSQTPVQSSAVAVVSEAATSAAASTPAAPTTLVTSLASVASSSSAAPSTFATSVATSAAAPATSAAASAAPSSGSGSSGSGSSGSGNSSSPWWFGVNLSGAEFGESAFPGVYNKDYTWYNESAIDILFDKGMNMFRINFLMERISPDTLTASQDNYYAKNLSATVDYITKKGAYAMIQPHNYGRFYKNVINDTAGFQTWWQNLATQYADNDLVVFDTNNEYHDMDQNLVVELNQAAINGIRAAGAKTQYITPEGNSWTGAWTWVSSTNGATLANLTDPEDSTGSKLIYQMHQYLDSDGSGTSETCVSTTIFKERLEAATAWLKANNKRGLIGEYAGGNNADCITALQGGLQYLKDNSDVWTGNLWWAAGPWWADYIYSMEPASGVAFSGVLSSIIDYAK